MMVHRRNSAFKYLHPMYHALKGLSIEVPEYAYAEAKALARVVHEIPSVEWYNALVAGRIAVVTALTVNPTMDADLLIALFRDPPPTDMAVVTAHLTGTLGSYVEVMQGKN